MFNGNGSYVDMPGSDVNFGGLSAMSFTAWFSPTSAAQGYLVYKPNQFYVQVNANGSIVFALYIGGAWVTLTAPAGSATLNGRLFGALSTMELTCTFTSMVLSLFSRLKRALLEAAQMILYWARKMLL